MNNFLSIVFPYWMYNLHMRRQHQIHPSSATSANETLIFSEQRSGKQSHKVFACSPKATKAGIEPGMSLELAKTICPSAETHGVRLAEVTQRFFKLACWSLRFTPLVSLHPQLQQILRRNELHLVMPQHFCLLLNLRGTERLYGGLQHCVDTLEKKFRSAGFDVRMALSPSSLASRALARFHHSPLSYIPWTDMKTAAQLLPVEALELSEQDCLALHELGLYTVQQVCDIPRKTLGSRFGKHLLHTLDIFFARAEEKLEYIQEPAPQVRLKDFSLPLFRKQIIIAETEKLLLQLLEKLEREQKAFPAVQLVFEGRSSGSGQAFCLRGCMSVSEELTRKKRLLSFLSSTIQALAFPGPVERISCVCDTSWTVEKKQQHIDEKVESLYEERRALNALVGNLALSLGAERVLRPKRVASYLPEEALQYAVAEQNYDTFLESKHQISEAPIALDVPPHIFDTPQPIEAVALLPDRPPAYILMGKKRIRIVQASGPERVALPWWQRGGGELQQAQADRREYFKVLGEDGRWLWVFRTNAHEKTMWFLHGSWE